MDKIDLDELERLAAQATPGPWVANNWGRVWYTPNTDSKRLVCDTMRNTMRNPKRWRANARLIAAMREALPELIARVRKLELQRKLLAKELVYRGHILGSVADADLCKPWIDAVEQAAKEAE
jgi:hypothetical protein